MSRILAGIVFALTLFSGLQARWQRGELFAPPSPAGDEAGYDRLGYNLASGLGFGYCPSDYKPLPAPPADGVCSPNCSPEEFDLTAYRPPGFPLLIAAIYVFRPMDFFLVRLANCLCCALATAGVAFYFARQYSGFSGAVVGLMCGVDPRFREFAGTFLTENLATLSLSLFALSMAGCDAQLNAVRAFRCGLSLSLLALVRSFYTVWYPFLWIVMAVIVERDRRAAGRSLRTALTLFLVFASSSLLLTGPWWLRNCIVLEALMPTGTQGGIGIADGFSDSAWENEGSWTSATANQIGAALRSEPGGAELTNIQFEREWCRRGMEHARSWIREHPGKLLRLSWGKLSRLWEFGNPKHMALFSLLALGLASTWRQPLTRVTFLLLVLNSLTVIATYHTYERFMTPFRPLIHGLAGCGLAAIATRVGAWLHRARQTG
jgi:hypothetical protein